jgi:hypothetical protein
VTTVVVGGALANKAGSGGEAWVRLSWVRGLQRLGLDVWFVEELAENDDASVAYFRSVVEAFDLVDRAVLLHQGEVVVGPSSAALSRLAPSATLVDISGHLAGTDLFPRFRRRVLVDIDPGFTQFWHAMGEPGANVEGHDAFFTIAENIGAPDCPIPTDGVPWRTVRQPVVLADWPVVAPGAPDRFTTIANWRGPFGSVVFAGCTYGLKVHEFRKMIELPRRSAQHFELALNIHPAEADDLHALRDHGWVVTDPSAVGDRPETFRDYVQGSSAEFSVAQGIYVDTNSGWFSDRTIRYLASGRPALVQDTGFSRSLPTGQGLVAFRTLDEAAAGADAIATAHHEHCAAARAVAEEHFDSDRVLSRFCDEAGVGT